MDPLSIAASAVGLAAFCGKVAEFLGQCVYNVHDAPETVTIFHENIRHLHAALDHVGRVLKHHRQEPFEREHLQSIRHILDSCRKATHGLSSKLPELSAVSGSSYGSFQQTCDAIALKLREDPIRQLCAQITSYTQILQLSISTLSLASLWRNQRSQDQIQVEIRALTDKIRSSGLVEWDDDPETLVQEDTTSLSNEIRQWKASVDDVAEAVTLRRPDETPPMPKIHATPADGVEAPPLGKAEPFGQDVLEYMLKANQKIVEQLIECGLFFKASQYQQKGLMFRNKLSSEYSVPFPFSEQADMKERLAETLMSCESRHGAIRARKLLKELLAEEEKCQGAEVKPVAPSVGAETMSKPRAPELTERACRLYNHLGRLNISLGHLEEAKTFLEQAFGGRRRQDPLPVALVRESAQLIIEVCMQIGAIDEAEGLTHWINDVLVSGPPDPEPKFAQGCGWCKSRGFHVDKVNFHFDSYDAALKTTPIHVAIHQRDGDMLRLMLGCLQSLAVLDTVCEENKLVRPLLMAASTRQDSLVSLLIGAGASPEIRDGNGQTALHKCQSKEDGCEAAERLLQACPGLVDAVDDAGKTALFMACEMGNGDMVALLLADGSADPNICHLAPSASGPVCVRSPLIAAIELVCRKRSKIGIVRLLLDHGADPNIADGNGWDARDWAKGAGLSRDRILMMIKTRTAGSRADMDKVTTRDTDSSGGSGVSRGGIPASSRRSSDASVLTGKTGTSQISRLGRLKRPFRWSSESGELV